MGIVGGDLGVNGCMELEKHKFRLKRLRLFLFLVRGVFVYGIVGYVKKEAMCSYLYVLTAVRASFLSLLKFLTHSLAIACLT